MKATYSNTRCQGVIITGTQGTVSITKKNKKSFYFKGEVEILNSDRKYNAEGKATYWKASADGTKEYYKDAVSGAVLTISK